jgi:hypothetical protein
MNDELRGLIARLAVDHALRLTGQMPADATPTQRRAMSELVDAADSLSADALAAWRLLVEGVPDQDAQRVLTLMIVQSVALLAIGRADRLAAGVGDGGGDAPIR